MAEIFNLDLEEKDKLCKLGKALSSSERLEILDALYGRPMIMGEIAKELHMPVSSAAFHLKILEESGLICIEEQAGTRGNTKLCIRKVDRVVLDLIRKNREVNEAFSAEMPVGAYSSCRVTPTCGLWGKDGQIGKDDLEYCFYYPERMHAGIVWSSSGYLEYKFANGLPKSREAKRISFSAEICSEAPGYNEDWKSDITLWINGRDCGTWTSPGDFGGRKGRLNPADYPAGKSQYGKLVFWQVTEEGSYVNGERVSDMTVGKLMLPERSYIAVRIGNKPEARYVGGFNLFGKQFGDYEQELILTIEY